MDSFVMLCYVTIIYMNSSLRKINLNTVYFSGDSHTVTGN
jgi:hypothetical protein